MTKSSKSRTPGTLSSAAELKKISDAVMRLGKAAGADETEVHLDETIEALTRFANNAIHQNVSEHGITVSVRLRVSKCF